MLIEYLFLLFFYPMKYIYHRSHGISFYSIYSTKEISFFGPYKFLVKVSFPFFLYFGGKRGLVVYKYCSCIFLDMIRDNAIYAVSRNEHAMPGSCVILSSLFFKNIFVFQHVSCFRKEKKKLISLFKRMISFFLSRAYLKMLF